MTTLRNKAAAVVVVCILISTAVLAACSSDPAANSSPASEGTAAPPTASPTSPSPQPDAPNQINFANGDTVPICLPADFEIVQPSPGIESEIGAIVGPAVELSIARGAFVVTDIHSIAGIPPVSQDAQLAERHVVEELTREERTITLVRPVVSADGSTGALVRSAAGDITINGHDLPADTESMALNMLRSMFANQC